MNDATSGVGISVIVPFYDSEDHIAACIESLRAQKDVLGTTELIFVDNGSSDGASAIVRAVDDLIVLEEEKQGAYTARNTGLRRSRGEIVAFTDADCIPDADWLASIQARMQDPSVGIVLGECRYPTDASRALHLLGAYENAKTEYVVGSSKPNLLYAHANNMAVRREVFREIGPFREWKRAADSEFAHRMAQAPQEWRVEFERSVRVTHMEFVSARQRLKRLRLYTATNSKIETFEELSPGDRLRIAVGMIRAAPAPRGPRGARLTD